MTRCDGFRIGEILVQQGALNAGQVRRVLEAQGRSARPFGELAERLFQVSSRDIERAWAAQYAQRYGCAEPKRLQIDSSVRDRITRRQAWQFTLVPLYEDAEGDLVLATTVEALPRAQRFARTQFGERIHLVIASRDWVQGTLRRAYPWPAMLMGGRGPVALTCGELVRERGVA